MVVKGNPRNQAQLSVFVYHFEESSNFGGTQGEFGRPMGLYPPKFFHLTLQVGGDQKTWPPTKNRVQM